MSVNPKRFQSVFNKNPEHYTDAEQKEMIRILRKAVKKVPDRPNDTVLFLRGDDVEKVMDMPKINAIYNDCFKSKFDDRDDAINPSHIYAFYITGASVISVVSMLTIDTSNVSSVTLWNVCKDLRLKGGYARVLMDVSLDYIRKKYIRKKLGVKNVQLYVLLRNPYYEKAVALYKSRGFKVDTRFVSEYGDRIRMIYSFL